MCNSPGELSDFNLKKLWGRILLGVVFQWEYATKSVFLCVKWRTEFLARCHSYQPQTRCIGLRHFSGSLYWGRKTYEAKIFQKWCMHEESFAPHEGRGWAVNPQTLCLRSSHPLVLLFPMPLRSPVKQLLCWAPWKESICRRICSSPEDAEQQRGSSVQLAERKQLISLFDANVNMFLLQSWVRVGTLRWLIYMKFLVCVKL